MTDVSEEDRALAFVNIEKAAQHYNVNLSETSWHDLGVHPQPHREDSVRNGAETRMRTREAKEAARKGGGHQRERLGIAEEAAKKAAAQPGAESAASDARRNERARQIIAHELHLCQLSERRHGPKESL